METPTNISIDEYECKLCNKKYKYEEFFIDEYRELDDYLCYIEEKIINFRLLYYVIFYLIYLHLLVLVHH